MTRWEGVRAGPARAALTRCAISGCKPSARNSGSSSGVVSGGAGQWRLWGVQESKPGAVCSAHVTIGCEQCAQLKGEARGGRSDCRRHAAWMPTSHGPSRGPTSCPLRAVFESNLWWAFVGTKTASALLGTAPRPSWAFCGLLVVAHKVLAQHGAVTVAHMASESLIAAVRWAPTEEPVAALLAAPHVAADKDRCAWERACWSRGPDRSNCRRRRRRSRHPERWGASPRPLAGRAPLASMRWAWR